jgi:hypothetical protein
VISATNYPYGDHIDLLIGYTDFETLMQVYEYSREVMLTMPDGHELSQADIIKQFAGRIDKEAIGRVFDEVARLLKKQGLVETFMRKAGRGRPTPALRKQN